LELGIKVDGTEDGPVGDNEGENVGAKEYSQVH
jgi:hypothetical protein